MGEISETLSADASPLISAMDAAAAAIDKVAEQWARLSEETAKGPAAASGGGGFGKLSEQAEAAADSVRSSVAGINESVATLGAGAEAAAAKLGSIRDAGAGLAGTADELKGIGESAAAAADGLKAAASGSGSLARSLAKVEGSADGAAAGVRSVGEAADASMAGLSGAADASKAMADANKAIADSAAEAAVAQDRQAVSGRRAATAAVESGGKIGKVARDTLLVGAIAGAYGVDQAMKLQTQVTRLFTAAGLKGVSQGTVSRAALQIGTQTGFSGEQIAEAMYHGASAGLNWKTIQGMTRQAANLANIHGANLDDTTYAMSSIMKAYNLGPKKTNSTAALLNSIVGQGDMRFQDLNQSVKNWAPSGAQMGISIQSMGAALAYLTDRGNSAEVASTRLTMGLSMVTSGSKEANTFLKDLGLTSGSVALKNESLAKVMNGYGLTTNKIAADLRKPDGIYTALTDMQGAFRKSGLTADQAGQVMSKIFGGGRSDKAIMSLMQNLDGVKQKYNQIGQGVKDYNKDVAAEQGTAQQQFKNLRAGAENLATGFGATILPYVNDVVKKVNGGFSALESSGGASKAVALGLGGVATAVLGNKLLGGVKDGLGAVGSLAKFLNIPGGDKLAGVGKDTSGSALSGAAGRLSGAAGSLESAAGSLRGAAGESGITGAEGAAGAGAAADAEGAAGAGAGGIAKKALTGGGLARAGVWTALGLGVTDLFVKPQLEKMKNSHGNWWDNAFGTPKSSGWNSNATFRHNTAHWFDNVFGQGSSSRPGLPGRESGLPEQVNAPGYISSRFDWARHTTANVTNFPKWGDDTLKGPAALSSWGNFGSFFSSRASWARHETPHVADTAQGWADDFAKGPSALSSWSKLSKLINNSPILKGPKAMSSWGSFGSFLGNRASWAGRETPHIADTARGWADDFAKGPSALSSWGNLSKLINGSAIGKALTGPKALSSWGSFGSFLGNRASWGGRFFTGAKPQLTRTGDGVRGSSVGISTTGGSKGLFGDVESMAKSIHLPKLKLPKVDFPKITVPHIDLPKLKLPKIDFPHIDVPHITLPKLKLPKIDTSALDSVGHDAAQAASKAGSAFASVKSKVSGALSGLGGVVSGAFAGAVSAAAAGADQVAAKAASIGGKVKAATASFGGLLVGAGEALMQGLAQGIEAGVGAAVGAAEHAASAVASAVKGMLGIRSPSRVFRGIGKNLIAGLVQGLQGGKQEITDAANDIKAQVTAPFKDSTIAATITKLEKDVAKALKSKTISKPEDSSLVKSLAADNGKLEALARRRSSLMTQIAAIKSYASNVTSSTTQAYDISTLWSNAGATAQKMQAGFGGNGQATAAGLISQYKTSVQQVQQFTTEVAQLKKSGLNTTTLGQLIQAGPQSGQPIAKAILSGGKGAISQFNSLQSQLTSSASKLGTVSANAMYEAGSQVGAGLASGLKSQLSSVTQAMQKMATSIVSTVKSALQIHSPSAVFHDIGESVGAGMALGIEESASSASSAAGKMAAGVKSAAGGGGHSSSGHPAMAAGGGSVRGGDGASASVHYHTHVHVAGSVVTENDLHKSMQKKTLQRANNNLGSGVKLRGRNA